MNINEQWKAVIADGHSIRSVEEGIYSTLREGSQPHLYDRRAAAYDLVVGTRLYHRVMWGALLSDYVKFAGQAVASHHDGIVLDAGCGSLLFTARAHLDCSRPILAFDQSLHMLRRARSRLTKLAGSVPGRILLLQADLSDLPFRPASFQTALCMNVLHHLADADGLIKGLKRLLVRGGELYLTSLVKGNRRIGDCYLDALYRRGDFAQPRESVALKDLLAGNFGQNIDYRVHGNMAYATAMVSTS